MKRQTIDFLMCPACHGKLLMQPSTMEDYLLSGSLACQGCCKTYPIKNGIPHFINQSELEGLNRTFAHLYNWFSWIYTAFSHVGFRFLGSTDARARTELVSRLAPHGKVLEVSIGPGVNLPFLLAEPAVTDVYGLDISIGQLNRCRSLIRRKNWPVDLFLGNAEELPFTGNSFDSVFHVGGINFFNNQKKAIDELIRVAKPGVRILICDETESGAEWYERFLPGFKGAFNGERKSVKAPIDLIPDEMLDVKLDDIWNGFMYCIQFQKP